MFAKSLHGNPRSTMDIILGNIGETLRIGIEDPGDSWFDELEE